jgi:Flp pilus assembly protein TadG
MISSNGDYSHDAGQTERTGGRMPRLRLRHWKTIVSRRAARMSLRDERGNALVEMAFVLPIMLMVVTAIFNFGLVLQHYLELTNAVSIGARQLAVSRSNTLDPCSLATSAIIGATPTLSSSNLSFTIVMNGDTYTGTSCPAASYTTGSAGDMKQGGSVKVTVTYPCNFQIYGHNYGACQLVGQTTEIFQ